jgi:hypothetical protein
MYVFQREERNAMMIMASFHWKNGIRKKDFTWINLPHDDLTFVIFQITNFPEYFQVGLHASVVEEGR